MARAGAAMACQCSYLAIAAVSCELLCWPRARSARGSCRRYPQADGCRQRDLPRIALCSPSRSTPAEAASRDTKMTMDRDAKIVEPVEMLSEAAENEPFQCLEQGQGSGRWNWAHYPSLMLLDQPEEYELHASKYSNSSKQRKNITGEEQCKYVRYGGSLIKSEHLLHHQLVHGGVRPYEDTDYKDTINGDLDLIQTLRIDSSGEPQKTIKREAPDMLMECERNLTNTYSHVEHQSVQILGNPCNVCHFSGRSTLTEQHFFHMEEKLSKSNSWGENSSVGSTCITQQIRFARVKPFTCHECGKSFTVSSSLIRHQKTHTEERPYPCTQCGKRFVEKFNLLNHQLTHTGVKPYSCEECGQRFTVRSSVIKHKRIHTGEKPYTCSECEKSFTAKSTLHQHQRIHTGQRAYACKECGKRFSRSYELCVHMRLHTGERPYACNECEIRFVKSSFLIRHLNIKHNRRTI